MYQSTLGLSAIKKKKKVQLPCFWSSSSSRCRFLICSPRGLWGGVGWGSGGFQGGEGSRGSTPRPRTAGPRGSRGNGRAPHRPVRFFDTPLLSRKESCGFDLDANAFRTGIRNSTNSRASSLKLTPCKFTEGARRVDGRCPRSAHTQRQDETPKHRTHQAGSTLNSSNRTARPRSRPAHTNVPRMRQVR